MSEKQVTHTPGHSGADLERDNLQAILDRVEGETAT